MGHYPLSQLHQDLRGSNLGSYPAPCEQWMLSVLQKFVPEGGIRTEALVMNRRRSLGYDIQASDWDEEQKELEKCLHQDIIRPKGRRSNSPTVYYGVVAIAGYAKLYEYRLEPGRSMIPSIPGDPVLHIGLKCATIQNFLNQIKNQPMLYI